MSDTVVPFRARSDAPLTMPPRGEFGLRQRDVHAGIDAAKQADARRTALEHVLSEIRDTFSTPPAILALRKAQDLRDQAETLLRTVPGLSAKHNANMIAVISESCTRLEADIQDGRQ